jgi:predicted transcriptional regulator
LDVRHRPFLQAFHHLNQNSKRGSSRNIAAHYDLGNALLSINARSEMAYSCAIFANDSTTLEQAQIAKFDAVCRKLDLRAGDRVVEIGTGWGGLALHAAESLRLSRHHHHDLARTTRLCPRENCARRADGPDHRCSKIATATCAAPSTKRCRSK